MTTLNIIRKFSRIGVFALLMIFSACQPIPIESSVIPSSSSTATLYQTETPAPSPTSHSATQDPNTPVALISSTPLLSEDTDETQTIADHMPTPTETLLAHDPTPLKFTFPTPAQMPVSLWRPPLYEAPWCPGPYDHFYFIRPIAVDEINWPLPDYRYGATYFGPAVVHTGIDIDAPKGTPVLAAAGGKVTWAGNGLYFGIYNPDDPYGNAVVIKHDFGYQNYPLYTVYAHLDRVDVVVGQRIETGEQIGLVGETGFTTGPHLHFEVRIGKNSFYVTRNPELWIVPPQGWGLLVGRLTDQKGKLLEQLEVIVRNKDKSKTWKVKTYALPGANSDDYYNENLVLSDLPAGDYTLEFSYGEDIYTYSFSVKPGQITYFTFSPYKGFISDLPDPQINTDWLQGSNQ